MTRPLHITVAAWRLGREFSGANRRLLALVQHAVPLLAPGERITVLHRPGMPLDEALAAVERRAVAVPAGPAWRRARVERQRLPALLRELHADVLETGYRPLPRDLPCPVSLTVHDLRDLHGWRRLPRRPSRWLLQRTLQRAATVTVPSAFTRREAQELCHGMAPPIHVVPNGVDPLFGYRAWTGNHGREYVLHVGHLERRKNLGVLIRGFRRWQEQPGSPEADLLLVGMDRGEGPRLKQIAAREGVSAHVHFAGRVAEDELRDLYLRAAAVAVPSAYEGFGLCALEGLAAGAPVLVSDQAALPEVVGRAGLVIPHDDPAAWAAGLQSAMALRGPKDIAGRRARAAGFTWPEAAAQQLRVWREAAQRR